MHVHANTGAAVRTGSTARMSAALRRSATGVDAFAMALQPRALPWFRSSHMYRFAASVVASAPPAPCLHITS